VIRDLRRHLFDHLLSTSLAFHERHPAGKLTTRVTSDVENINELIATGVLQSVFDLLKIVGVLIVLFFLDVRLAWFTLASTPVVVVLSVLFRQNAQRAYRAVRGRLALQNAYTTELIGGVRTTRAFAREGATEARYAERNRDTAAAWRATVLHFSVFFSWSTWRCAARRSACSGSVAVPFWTARCNRASSSSSGSTTACCRHR
jgi:ATP-binding cassette subfamily B multidrug efflux pump